MADMSWEEKKVRKFLEKKEGELETMKEASRISRQHPYNLQTEIHQNLKWGNRLLTSWEGGEAPHGQEKIKDLLKTLEVGNKSRVEFYSFLLAGYGVYGSRKYAKMRANLIELLAHSVAVAGLKAGEAYNKHLSEPAKKLLEILIGELRKIDKGKTQIFKFDKTNINWRGVDMEIMGYIRGFLKSIHGTLEKEKTVSEEKRTALKEFIDWLSKYRDKRKKAIGRIRGLEGPGFLKWGHKLESYDLMDETSTLGRYFQKLLGQEGIGREAIRKKAMEGSTNLLKETRKMLNSFKEEGREWEEIAKKYFKNEGVSIKDEWLILTDKRSGEFRKFRIFMDEFMAHTLPTVGKQLSPEEVWTEAFGKGRVLRGAGIRTMKPKPREAYESIGRLIDGIGKGYRIVGPSNFPEIIGKDPENVMWGLEAKEGIISYLKHTWEKGHSQDKPGRIHFCPREALNRKNFGMRMKVRRAGGGDEEKWETGSFEQFKAYYPDHKERFNWGKVVEDSKKGKIFSPSGSPNPEDFQWGLEDFIGERSEEVRLLTGGYIRAVWAMLGLIAHLLFYLEDKTSHKIGL